MRFPAVQSIFVGLSPIPGLHALYPKHLWDFSLAVFGCDITIQLMWWTNIMLSGNEEGARDGKMVKASVA